MDIEDLGGKNKEDKAIKKKKKSGYLCQSCGERARLVKVTHLPGLGKCPFCQTIVPKTKF